MKWSTRTVAMASRRAAWNQVSRAGAMSTTGTASEVYHYLRLLFAATAVPYCPEHGLPEEATSQATSAEKPPAKQGNGG